MTGSITFYTNPMSRGQIARWALHEAGADYTQVLLDYGGTIKGADFLAINPMGKVPAIVHGDQVVTETAAICAYLADHFPEAKLAPTMHERADYYRWMFFAAGPMEAAITNRAFGFNVDEKAQRSAGYGHYDLMVETLEGWLKDRDYICGERFTAADIYVGAQVDWGLAFGTLPENDAFYAYAERMRWRPAYQAAKAIDSELINAAQRTASAT